MHVLTPREITKRKQDKEKAVRRGARLAFVAVIFLIAAVGGFGWFIFSKVQPESSSQKPAEVVAQPDTIKEVAAPKQNTNLKIFTGIQFRDLYRSISYPNTQSYTSPPEITGNKAADERIRVLAEKRGFVLTSIPVAPIEKSGEELTGAYQDDLLQPLAAKSWQETKAAAKTDGIMMSLISGYRSPKSQRELFTERLYATGVTAAQIVSGSADNIVNATLGLTAVPGYSRHHTGYTIDIQCDDGLAFGNSSCNVWLSENNFANAKKFGWIPSYPPDGGEQGPEPEPWEYVWVGKDALYE